MNAESGIGWVSLGAGAIILYSAIKGYSVLKAAENIIQGKSANQGQSVSLLSSGNGTSAGGANNESIPAGAGSAQKWAKAHLKDYGWGLDQFAPLVSLWNGESGWNYKAQNSSSGAYGIPQALPGAKMASAGADWATNPVTQMKWGMGYIKDRYGSPQAAYSFWLSQSPHWY